MKIDFELKKITKAYFSAGKPCLLVKLSLPRIKRENIEFQKLVNRFYDEISAEYLDLASRIIKACEKRPSLAVLSVICNKNEGDVGTFCVKRSVKLKLSSSEEHSAEYSDVFDITSGLLMRASHKKRNRKKKSAENKMGSPEV